MEGCSKILVTGGAGFIGSHLVDALMVRGFHVKVVDNLSSGDLKNVEGWMGNSRFELVQGDLKDLVDAFFAVLDGFGEGGFVEVYNVGSLDQIDVVRVAEVVCEEMGLRDVAFRFTGGVDGGRGWRGDVKTMLLSTDKLVNLGWRPKLNSEEAVRLSCRELLKSEN